MSGLAGLFRLSGRPDLDPLARLLRVLDARGPDRRAEVRLADGAIGVVVRAPGESGDDPAWDPSGRWCVATDGELLNRRPLLAELRAWEHGPSSESSAAVAACIFAENGFERGLARLAGDVAIVAWDGVERRLWLARDRAGVRPLHYAALPDGTLVFASEPAAILAHPDVDRTPDPVALGELLAIGLVPAPRTAWRAVRKLGPGELLSFGADGVRITRWWEDAANPGGTGGARYRWARSAQFSVELAIQQRVAVEGPIAVALSGGIYAEVLLAATAARRRGPVRTFTIGFDGPGDERARARAVATRCRSEHVEVVLGAADVPGLLTEIGAAGEPIVAPAALGWWALARAAWEHEAETLLAGTGGVEHFGGPSAYFAERAASVPGAGLVGRVARATGLSALGEPWARRHLLRTRGAPGGEDIDALAATCPSPDPAGAALWLDRRLLAEDGLAVADRATAAHGVRFQAPLADANLARLAASIPIAHLVQVRRNRGLFLDAMGERLSGEDPGSRGMKLPVEAWLADGELERSVVGDLEGVLSAEQAASARTPEARWRLVALAAWRRGNGV